MKKSKLRAVGRRDLHVTLPRDEVEYLDRVASEKETTRNAVVREALTAYRVSETKIRVEAEMRAWVERHAEHSLEVTKEFEPHVIEVLMRDTEW